jgi:hypothetical protein
MSQNDPLGILKAQGKRPSSLDVVVVVITMRELVGIVPLILVHNCDSVSEEMIHTIMAGACTHLGLSGGVDCLFNDSIAQSMIVLDAVI